MTNQSLRVIRDEDDYIAPRHVPVLYREVAPARRPALLEPLAVAAALFALSVFTGAVLL